MVRPQLAEHLLAETALLGRFLPRLGPLLQGAASFFRQEPAMDITVRRTGEGSTWSLEDLLGRPMGSIAEDRPKHFTIHPEGQALETMRGLSPGPYASLDAALAEIETHTRGVCRMDIDHGE